MGGVKIERVKSLYMNRYLNNYNPVFENNTGKEKQDELMTSYRLVDISPNA